MPYALVDKVDVEYSFQRVPSDHGPVAPVERVVVLGVLVDRLVHITVESTQRRLARDEEEGGRREEERGRGGGEEKRGKGDGSVVSTLARTPVYLYAFSFVYHWY